MVHPCKLSPRKLVTSLSFELTMKGGSGAFGYFETTKDVSNLTKVSYTFQSFRSRFRYLIL
jgi:hypothetical protein